MPFFANARATAIRSTAIPDEKRTGQDAAQRLTAGVIIAERNGASSGSGARSRSRAVSQPFPPIAYTAAFAAAVATPPAGGPCPSTKMVRARWLAARMAVTSCLVA
jgi:hypothetical protein